jgi:hypothetical protein
VTGVRGVAFLLLTLGFSGAAAAGSAPPVPTPVAGPTSNQSAADVAHRWRLAGAPDAEGRYRFVDATENGGRTWHRILRRPAHDIVRITRTTVRNGFVLVDGDPAVLATASNGRSWRPLALSPRPVPTVFEGNGSDLFFGLAVAPGVEFGGYVMKVSDAAHGRARIRPFLTRPDSHARRYVALQAVPRGIAALVEGTAVDGAPGVAFRIHFGRLSPDRKRVELIVLNVPRAAGAACSARLFRVRWPSIRIVAPVVLSGDASCATGSVSYDWVSHDGGRSWRVAAGH